MHSTPRAYQRYLLRVPNELDIPTTRVEIRFPAGVRVISFADVPRWQLEVVRDSAKRVTSAVWTGSLAPGLVRTRGGSSRLPLLLAAGAGLAAMASLVVALARRPTRA